MLAFTSKGLYQHGCDIETGQVNLKLASVLGSAVFGAEVAGLLSSCRGIGRTPGRDHFAKFANLSAQVEEFPQSPHGGAGLRPLQPHQSLQPTDPLFQGQKYSNSLRAVRERWGRIRGALKRLAALGLGR
jgi:hypothetical protein